MPLTHSRKKTFEIYCCGVASVEYTDEIFLLIFWKCIFSRIWKFLCCSFLAFLFWSLTLFGDSEWMQRKIHNSIFSKNIDNFFNICSFFVALLLLFPFLPVDFEAQFKVDPRIDTPYFDRLIHLIIWEIWPNPGIN